MADQDQTARPLSKAVAQSRAPRQVQMIAGLVQDQPVGVGAQRREQGDALALAAAERRAGSIRTHSVQAGVGQQLLERGFAIPAIMKQLVVALIQRAVADAPERRQRFRHSRQMRGGGVGVGIDLLRQAMDAALALHASGMRGELARQQLSQQRFAAAVAAD
nr:hypothetical protein [Chromobacterium phragmitis]